MTKIREWKAARSSDSLSEALRQMVDAAHRRRTQVAEYGGRKRAHVVQTSAQGTE